MTPAAVTNAPTSPQEGPAQSSSALSRDGLVKVDQRNSNRKHAITIMHPLNAIVEANATRGDVVQQQIQMNDVQSEAEEAMEDVEVGSNNKKRKRMEEDIPSTRRTRSALDRRPPTILCPPLPRVPLLLPLMSCPPLPPPPALPSHAHFLPEIAPRSPTFKAKHNAHAASGDSTQLEGQKVIAGSLFRLVLSWDGRIGGPFKWWLCLKDGVPGLGATYRGYVLVGALLAQLVGVLKTPARRKALQELKDNRAQLLIDFLYWVLLQPRAPSQEPWLRKHTLIVLCKLSGASMLYPHWYVLRNITYQSHEDSGGFCDIYKGRCDSLELCLKLVRVAQKPQLERVLKVFAKEAILWGQLHHPNITPFYGIFYLNDTQRMICLVSPWMSNGNIVTYLERNPTASRKPLIRDIASGLKYLHDENIIHADLKGMNILVDNFGRACITDFGISTIWTNKTLGFTHMTAGVVGRSVRWASPELLKEGASPSRESDIWAFGCVCYEVLTRRLPFRDCTQDYQIIFLLVEGKPPAQRGVESRLEDISDPVDDNMWKLMNWCWSARPAERPICKQILEKLELEGLADMEPNAKARSSQEGQYLRAALGKSPDIKIDMAKVGEILAEL